MLVLGDINTHANHDDTSGMCLFDTGFTGRFTLVILFDGKKKFLEQLETFSINRVALFPEIECVAEYLKNKYINMSDKMWVLRKPISTPTFYRYRDNFLQLIRLCLISVMLVSS